ncbi:Hpt domain-containing protein, partial [Myxococcota bacterium]|nr:Hpt domain-containing protein [Myxococcota bacterium]
LHGAMLDAELRVVEREAHSLKGAATNLGAERLTRAARDVEDEAARGHLPGDDAIAALVREVAALLDAIEKVDFERLPRRDEARALR